jgi:hypothetical protein
MTRPPIHTLVLSLILTTPLFAAPAIGLDGPDSHDPVVLPIAETLTPRVRFPALATAIDGPPSAIRRLHQRLVDLPLRPVQIGSTPHLPSDPEPGVGLVVKLRF